MNGQTDWIAVADAFHAEYEKNKNMAPTAIRAGFHMSITYDAATKTGGTNGATILVDAKEKNDPDNRGISVYTDFVAATIKPNFPNASLADLCTLGAAVAVPHLGGPEIIWRPGRSDFEGKACPNQCPFKPGMLPQADLVSMTKTRRQIQTTFKRMGFGKREMVVLLGAHAVGKMHTNFSKFEGTWTTTPLVFSNEYYKNNIGLAWTETKSPAGLRQFKVKDPKKDNKTVMLLADLMLSADSTPDLKKIGLQYARNKNKFFRDFAATFSRMLNNGVPIAQV